MPNIDIRPLQALVVDDEADIRDLLSEHLRIRGLDVTTAHDGQAAIAALARSRGCYPLVLTDINLPGADGFDVLRAARAANPATSVVVITGYASLDSAIQAVRLGARDYLTKPFTLGQIDVILRNVGERLSLEQENRELTARAAATGSHGIGTKLHEIERRLASIEALLAHDRP